MLGVDCGPTAFGTVFATIRAFFRYSFCCISAVENINSYHWSLDVAHSCETFNALFLLTANYSVLKMITSLFFVI